MTSLGVILARGGSKGIPRKNLVELGGKPLLLWTIEAALESGLDDVWVSTDSDEIAAVATAAGARAIERPAQMATDGAPPELAMSHAIGIYEGERGELPDVVVRLQPTSPFRSVEDINNALNIVADGAHSVIGISEMSDHPHLEVSIGGRFVAPHPHLRQPRQDYPAAWAINGAIYCARTLYWLANAGFYGAKTQGYVMPPERSLDIDSDWDLRVARALA